VATSRRRTHRSRYDGYLGELLVDMAWGLAFGIPAGLIAWLATLGWWAVH
jgi:hypothetical protein